ncbi:hypothetical protein OB920_07725 [Halobacteria archaeon HArc-gm2]|nr:hypothetical protein [Halobacteria archaeon HArc-gm2]
MPTDDLTAITGISGTTSGRLQEAGIRTATDLRESLIELDSGIDHIYSSWLIPVVEDLDLPTADGDSLSQYELVEKEGDHRLYTWDREPADVHLEIVPDESKYTVHLYTDTHDTIASKTVETWNDALDQATRFAYRPLDSSEFNSIAG